MKRVLLAIAVLLLAFFVGGQILFPGDEMPGVEKLGVTFSPMHAEYLGYEPAQMFDGVLDELDVKLVRLPVYWDRVQATRDVYDWRETDVLLKLADEHDIEVILATGARVPRWPECFKPAWVDDLGVEEARKAQLGFVTAVIERYKDRLEIVRWQVENEPFLRFFGDCEVMTVSDVRGEVDLVRGLDPTREIQVSASGELSSWMREARVADIVGTSLYRTTHTPVLGHTTYPIPAWFYRAKARIARPAEVVVSELQMEPWFERSQKTYTPEEQLAIFDVKNFERNLNYAEKVGLSEVSLWGVEWWFDMKEKGHPELWEAAKQLDW